jgi:hypothetical protein
MDVPIRPMKKYLGAIKIVAINLIVLPHNGIL